MMVPVLYLVLFGPLLEGAMQSAGTGTNAFNWFVPGLIIQIAIFGTAFGGFGLIAELRSGVVERMRVTPMSRASMLLGRSLRDVVILMVQATIMILLAIPFGLQIDALEHRRHARSAPADRAVRGAAVVRRRPVSEDRGRVRAAGQRDRPAAAAAVGDPAADGPGAGLAPVPEHDQPADARGRCRSGAVQRRLGQPGRRASAWRSARSSPSSRSGSARGRSVARSPDPSAPRRFRRRPARRAGRRRMHAAPTIGP